MRRRGALNDDGGAIVEFLGITVLLLIPLVYVVIALAQVQAATFASEGAARSAARVVVTTGVEALRDGETTTGAFTQGVGDAHAVVDLARADFGPHAVSLEVECVGACLSPGSVVTSQVTMTVRLPGAPDFLAGVIPLDVAVSARGSSPVPGDAP